MQAGKVPCQARCLQFRVHGLETLCTWQRQGDREDTPAMKPSLLLHLHGANNNSERFVSVLLVLLVTLLQASAKGLCGFLWEVGEGLCMPLFEQGNEVLRTSDLPPTTWVIRDRDEDEPRCSSVLHPSAAHKPPWLHRREQTEERGLRVLSSDLEGQEPG